MKKQHEDYVKSLKKKGQMILQRNHNTFESMTIEEYNFRKDVEIESWDEVNDDELYSPDEFMEYFGDEKEIYFI